MRARTHARTQTRTHTRARTHTHTHTHTNTHTHTPQHTTPHTNTTTPSAIADGQLNYLEIKKGLETSPEFKDLLGGKSFKKFWKQADDDGDKVVTKEEFISFFSPEEPAVAVAAAGPVAEPAAAEEAPTQEASDDLPDQVTLDLISSVSAETVNAVFDQLFKELDGEEAGGEAGAGAGDAAGQAEAAGKAAEELDEEHKVGLSLFLHSLFYTPNSTMYSFLYTQITSTHVFCAGRHQDPGRVPWAAGAA